MIVIHLSEGKRPATTNHTFIIKDSWRIFAKLSLGDCFYSLKDQ